MIPGSGQHAHLNALDRHSPAWLDSHAGVSRDSLFVGCIIRARHLRILQIGPVINEGSDLDAIHQLRNSAYVVAMIVRDEHVVDLLEAGLVSGGENAIGVPTFVAWPARVDEQRLP